LYFFNCFHPGNGFHFHFPRMVPIDYHEWTAKHISFMLTESPDFSIVYCGCGAKEITAFFNMRVCIHCKNEIEIFCP